MAHWQLWIRYDGAGYHGWQVQPNGVTVQQTLQDAVERVTGVRSGITGCSRTDAGVHALQFCCALRTDSGMPPEQVAAALNANLPRDIAVMTCREVGEDFHPRYGAVGKQYVYRIHNAPTRDPFLQGRAWHIRRRLDVDKMAAAAAALIGRHDFAAFCAAGSEVEDTVRTLSTCAVTRTGDLVEIRVAADGFLYNMVRIIVGTLLEIERGRLSPDDIPAILASGDRSRAGATAPAEGLYLERVFYPADSGLNLETE